MPVPAVAAPAPVPAGFPNCARCPCLAGAVPPGVCLRCLIDSQQRDRVPRCSVCSQLLPPAGHCSNRLCRSSSRHITRIDAIAGVDPTLRGVIHDYKYRGHAGWARVFARLLLGWLDAHASHDPPDLIVANPGFAPDGQLGHTERVLAVARRLDATHRWPIDPLHPPALVKTAPTARSAAAEAADKLAIADAHRRQLRIPTPHRVRGRRIVVFDDVATTGFQLDAVAACLLDDGGALEVRGLVIGRAPW